MSDVLEVDHSQRHWWPQGRLHSVLFPGRIAPRWLGRACVAVVIIYPVTFNETVVLSVACRVARLPRRIDQVGRYMWSSCRSSVLLTYIDIISGLLVRVPHLVVSWHGGLSAYCNIICEINKSAAISSCPRRSSTSNRRLSDIAF